MRRIIVTLSGGKASAWCAGWALKNYPKEKVVLYFNDTLWEHPDLHRFLEDLSNYFNHPITYDSDGRNPEQLFYDNNSLANDRMPFCSRILKKEVALRYFRNMDTIIFGMGKGEERRIKGLVKIYQLLAIRKKKICKLRFPLVENNITRQDIDLFLRNTEIEEPLLYRLGFSHNNCSGGCVRAGKKHWKLLYEVLPEIYADRERVEREMREHTGKDIHFFKDETLEHFRGRIERGELSKHYDTKNKT